MIKINARRDGIAAGKAGKVNLTEFTAPPLADQAYSDADDLRVEHIAAQLEEAEQQRLTDDWIASAKRRRLGAAALLLESRRQAERPEARAAVERSSAERTRPRSECCTARAACRTDPIS
jgi:hypothetical protein